MPLGEYRESSQQQSETLERRMSGVRCSRTCLLYTHLRGTLLLSFDGEEGRAATGLAEALRGVVAVTRAAEAAAAVRAEKLRCASASLEVTSVSWRLSMSAWAIGAPVHPVCMREGT